MHWCALSWRFYRLLPVQTWLAARLYVKVGKENFHNQKNDGEISSGKLRHGDMCDLIEMDIFETSEKHTVYAFAVMEKLRLETFLPHLFYGK